MGEQGIWPKTEISIHSANAVAADYMTAMIERYSGFQKELGKLVFRRP
jgi:hypothetical protein